MKLKSAHYFLGILLLVCTKVLAAVKESFYQYSDKMIPLDYKSYYDSKDYIYKKQDPSFIQNLKEWVLELLNRILRNVGVDSKNSEYIALVFYVLIAAIAVYVIAKMFLQQDGQWVFKRKKDVQTLIYDTEVAAIETADFEELISQALLDNEYRLSVKYYYLWVLQKLSEQELIILNNLKTNADYQLEIKDTEYVEIFKRVSYYYNYVWYGEFNIDVVAFNSIQEIYTTFLKDLSK